VVTEEQSKDVWSQRLRELDRVGGLALAALILIGLYNLATTQLQNYSEAISALAKSNQIVAETLIKINQGQMAITRAMEKSATADEDMARALASGCIPPHRHRQGETD